ncbi:hypothetical protein ACIPJG_32485 [Streptomyces halstedii]|uniref:hypothetical protein n=1 Tax=Streptomyces halstedii TaxID=1944 RepID=UPI0037F9C8FB
MGEDEVSEEVFDLREELAEAHRQRAFQREEDAGRIAALRGDVARLERALRLSEAKVGGAALYVEQADARSSMLEGALTAYEGIADERSSRLRRYRLAWLSARRRAADDAQFLPEALALKDAEIARLRAELDASRKSTYVGHLECLGTVDGDEVYRLKRS